MITEDGHTHLIYTRATLGVTVDPYNEHRFLSYDEGNIYLWDDRKISESISISVYIIKFYEILHYYNHSYLLLL